MDPKLVEEAETRLRGVVTRTPLELSQRLSKKYGAKIYLKREDLQIVRSYKIRGAYNMMSQLTASDRRKGVVCASAGNHAQGVALSCSLLRTKGHIFMPENTPKQKLERVKSFGGQWITTHLCGNNFDDSYQKAEVFCRKNRMTFIHPFNDEQVIAGQGTVGMEILQQLQTPPDYMVVPVGGGGLVAGLGSYLKAKQPALKLIGVEPDGAPSMTNSLLAGKVIKLKEVDKFIDGAAVKCVGNLAFRMSKKLIDQMLMVPEGKVCQEMISLYQSDGIIAEPAGALSVAALDDLRDQIAGKTVVCIVSGGNNDISRYSEIIERSLVYRGLKHYFIIEFSQRPGALRRYLDEALGKNDDITLFEYVKKNNRETGPALVGIELSRPADLEPLLTRMSRIGLTYERLKNDSIIFKFLV